MAITDKDQKNQKTYFAHDAIFLIDSIVARKNLKPRMYTLLST